MPDRAYVKGANGFSERAESVESAKARAKERIDAGEWSFVEVIVDVGLPTGAGKMQYHCLDQNETFWVKRDIEPTGPADCEQ